MALHGGRHQIMFRNSFRNTAVADWNRGVAMFGLRNWHWIPADLFRLSRNAVPLLLRGVA